MRNLLVSILVGCLGLVVIPMGWACSCTANPPPSDVEFIGQVLEIVRFPSEYRVEVEFRVLERRKGLYNKESIKVITNLHEASCGYPFEVEKVYLVRGNWHSRKLYTDLCSGTEYLDIVPVQGFEAVPEPEGVEITTDVFGDSPQD